MTDLEQALVELASLYPTIEDPAARIRHAIKEIERYEARLGKTLREEKFVSSFEGVSHGVDLFLFRAFEESPTEWDMPL